MESNFSFSLSVSIRLVFSSELYGIFIRFDDSRLHILSVWKSLKPVVWERNYSFLHIHSF